MASSFTTTAAAAQQAGIHYPAPHHVVQENRRCTFIGVTGMEKQVGWPVATKAKTYEEVPSRRSSPRRCGRPTATGATSETSRFWSWRSRSCRFGALSLAMSPYLDFPFYIFGSINPSV